MTHRPDLSRYVPLGVDWRSEGKLFCGLLIGAVLFSLGFFQRMSRHLGDLYWYQYGKHTLIPGAVMADFDVVLGRALLGFAVAAVCMAALGALHYARHWRESKSIYLMRRLPDRWELHRRCLALPVMAVALCLLIALALLLLYFGIYLAATPEQCLRPGQWQNIWR